MIRKNGSSGTTAGGANQILASLGIDNETFAMIVQAGASYVFENDDAAWNSEVPSTKSLVAKLLKTATDVQSISDSPMQAFLPLMTLFSSLKDAKRRVHYADFDAQSRDAIDAVLLSCPVSELDMVNEKWIKDFVPDRMTGKVHLITSKLMP